MEKWEYISRFMYAHEEGYKAKESVEFYNQEHGKERYPLEPRKYSPQFMIATLNNMGEQGWEIVHMQPIAGVTKDGSVFFHDAPTSNNVYF